MKTTFLLLIFVVSAFASEPVSCFPCFFLHFRVSCLFCVLVLFVVAFKCNWTVCFWFFGTQPSPMLLFLFLLLSHLFFGFVFRVFSSLQSSCCNKMVSSVWEWQRRKVCSNSSHSCSSRALFRCRSILVEDHHVPSFPRMRTSLGWFVKSFFFFFPFLLFALSFISFECLLDYFAVNCFSLFFRVSEMRFDLDPCECEACLVLRSKWLRGLLHLVASRLSLCIRLHRSVLCSCFPFLSFSILLFMLLCSQYAFSLCFAFFALLVISDCPEPC